jgi:hypothetical protein
VANTVRQVGGALGIAVLGAVVMAVYRGQVAPAVAALPAGARDGARESIAGAYAVADRVDAPGLVPAANDAFLTAIHAAAGASTVITLLTVLVVLRWLPGRPKSATATATAPAPPAERRAEPDPDLAPAAAGGGT